MAFAAFIAVSGVASPKTSNARSQSSTHQPLTAPAPLTCGGCGAPLSYAGAGCTYCGRARLTVGYGQPFSRPADQRPGGIAYIDPPAGLYGLHLGPQSTVQLAEQDQLRLAMAGQLALDTERAILSYEAVAPDSCQPSDSGTSFTDCGFGTSSGGDQ